MNSWGSTPSLPTERLASTGTALPGVRHAACVVSVVFLIVRTEVCNTSLDFDFRHLAGAGDSDKVRLVWQYAPTEVRDYDIRPLVEEIGVAECQLYLLDGQFSFQRTHCFEFLFLPPAEVRGSPGCAAPPSAGGQESSRSFFARRV